MTNHPLPSRTEPAGWTAAHRRERDYLASRGVDVSDAHPEWLETRTVIEDVDGWPAGLVVRRLPVVVKRSGCQCGVTHTPRPVPPGGYSDHDDLGDPGPDGEAGHDG